jgi:hypothetical protein
MHYRGHLIGAVLALVLLPTVAASQPQVPTPTGHLGGRVSADETPTVGMIATVSVTPPGSPEAADVPGEAACDVVPRERDIAELSGPPAANIVSPTETRRGVPTRTLAEMPTGEPVDDVTVREITAAVRRLVACSNSQDVRAYEALYTDDYFRRAATVEVEREESEGPIDWLFGVSETTSVSYGFVSFPPQSPMLAVTDVRTLADGRVGAVVRGPGFSPIFFAFDREEPDGPYLVDEAILIEENPATPRA